MRRVEFFGKSTIQTLSSFDYSLIVIFKVGISRGLIPISIRAIARGSHSSITPKASGSLRWDSSGSLNSKSNGIIPIAIGTVARNPSIVHRNSLRWS